MAPVLTFVRGKTDTTTDHEYSEYSTGLSTMDLMGTVQTKIDVDGLLQMWSSSRTDKTRQKSFQRRHSLSPHSKTSSKDDKGYWSSLISSKSNYNSRLETESEEKIFGHATDIQATVQYETLGRTMNRELIDLKEGSLSHWRMTFYAPHEWSHVGSVKSKDESPHEWVFL